MQKPNQFKQSVVKGMLDLAYGNKIFPCLVDSTQATPLKAGMVVSLVPTGAGGPPKIIETADDTTALFGVVCYNTKQAEFKAQDSVEVAAFDSVIYVEASAAIARGAKVSYVQASAKVKTAVAGNKVLGMALDVASGDGDLIRIAVASATVDAVIA